MMYRARINKYVNKAGIEAARELAKILQENKSYEITINIIDPLKGRQD